MDKSAGMSGSPCSALLAYVALRHVTFSAVLVEPGVDVGTARKLAGNGEEEGEGWARPTTFGARPAHRDLLLRASELRADDAEPEVCLRGWHCSHLPGVAGRIGLEVQDRVHRSPRWAMMRSPKPSRISCWSARNAGHKLWLICRLVEL